MRTQLRIVAGSLRGRKLTCTVNPGLRPTPQMVREALFSILGHAVPGRPFLDLFAGTGVVGLEALSRGASEVVFVERDFRLVEDIERHLRAFGLEGRATVARADVYRWAERWPAPPEPVTLFLSPPFADFERRQEDLFRLAGGLQEKAAAGSVLVLQAEASADLAGLPDRAAWDERRYGRNHLLIWVKEPGGPAETGEAPGGPHDTTSV
jgi:16S rRNA (guanine(966)-N(2))-methyltransferase RsmD